MHVSELGRERGREKERTLGPRQPAPQIQHRVGAQSHNPEITT